MTKYKNGMDLALAYNLKNLHFFTNEYIARKIQKITAKPLPAETSLPSFHLYVDEDDIESLELDLPASAKLQFKQSHIKINNPTFSGEAQFRYRGGLPLHWLYNKKSIRVKLPAFSTYRNERQFNLVNPSTIHTITDWLSYDMARSVGLLTPEYFPARVFINNEKNGLHFFLSRIDESFLRKNNRMPGSIYSGDTIYIANLFGVDTGMNEQTYLSDDGVSLMWKDYRLWEKNASRNADSSNDREDIKIFVRIMNEPNPLAFMHAFDSYFNKEKYYLFWGLDALVGSYHHDLYHNHKMYFDPYKGKFEPIEWDIRFWDAYMPQPITPFLKQILLNPVLKYELDSKTYQLWKKFPVNYINSMIDDANKIIINEMAADPYRHHPDPNIKFFGFDKVFPFSMDEYANAIEDLKQTYKLKHKILKHQFNSIESIYSLEKISETEWKISIAVDGNSPVDFDPWSIISKSSDEDIQIFRVYQDIKLPVLKNGELDRLYPGLAINSNFDLANMDTMATMQYGMNFYVPSPIHYSYLIIGNNLSNSIPAGNLTSSNAITKTDYTIEKTIDLPEEKNSLSIHPWNLLALTNPSDEEIILSGEIDVHHDIVYGKQQTVTILPGTVFKLLENRSIFFYGKVIAEGTETSPIKFEQKNSGQPWGSIVIQGKKASGSILSHIDIRGGSVATRNLIHYPGQFNIHDVNPFQLDHCNISNNNIGDDSLHIAYSQGTIQSCTFEDTPFDALDMDIVDVKVSDSNFYNNGNDAIDLMNSTADINNVNIIQSGDKCISVGEASHVTIENSQLHDCQTGIAVKDESIVSVENIEFSIEQGTTISLYRKNPRYSKGGEIHGTRLYGITETDIDVGEFSINNLQSNSYHSSSYLNTDHDGIK